ncbi:DUF6531 domain-containing protein [Lysinibacter sp. HNR]|uniref:DUF6531 domain-containing protein n=1 Tax=Lysinibacter sp. HNR TaxID=3031408 RepID=UPI00243587D7|nr:DUF6531 domain-containing protein [Lysinibacter sp. HNR]WGD37427.1 DUF6531 domain-containing protein [Lysinibacter sp. HNR]
MNRARHTRGGAHVNPGGKRTEQGVVGQGAETGPGGKCTMRASLTRDSLLRRITLPFGLRRVRHGFARVGKIALVGSAVLGLSLQLGVTPALASPAVVQAYVAEQNLREVREAAARAQIAPEREEAPGEVVDTLARGQITPGKESTIGEPRSGASVSFSGFKIEEELDVTVSSLPDRAARTARSETGGVVVTDPIDISATTDTGEQVTSFPAEVETGRDSEDEPERVVSIVPGISLDIPVEKKRITDLDTGSLKIYTREGLGAAWSVIPSYFDKDTHSVKGEIDHLSQFAVIGEKFVPPPGPVIVLDPDDDVGHTEGPNGPMTELPQNIRLAQGMRDAFVNSCRANVVITREDPGVRFVSHATRAGIAAAQNPALTITLAFDAFQGRPWGTESSGGSKVYHRGATLNDQAVAAFMVDNLPAYTSRRALHTSSVNYPNSAFDRLPGAVAHLETLYIDHNFDRPVIDNGFQHIVNGAFTGAGKYLESVGFDCTDPVTGGWPAPPSDAEKAKWRNLGYQNYLMYGADPVSFSTGNLIEDEPIFTLTGSGGQELDLTLIYNSQDGRESRVGAGWSFGVGARAQRFDDGSVMVVRGDGASFVFTSNGVGGYIGESGLYQTLTENGDGKLTLTAVDGEKWVFDAADIEGIGELVQHTDRQGKSYTLTYAAGNPDVHRFVPLASITDGSGQTVTVGSDGLGRISSFTHPDGRTWSLGYNGAGDLVSITNPDGRVRGFSYDGAHQMLTATDASGVTYLRNEFDGEGRVVRQRDADNNLRTFSYDPGAGTTTYVDNEGTETLFHYDSKSRITGTTNAAGKRSSYVYDDRNQVTKHTDEVGNTWAYTYDTSGNVTTETLPDGSVVSYTYTPAGDVVSVTDTGGMGGALRTETYDVDPLGLVRGTHLPDGSTTRNDYDALGNLTRLVDEAGNATVMT